MLARRLRGIESAKRRAEAVVSRNDTRTWVMQRRERTRHLIELGGLVQKAGLIDALEADRAALYGALLALSDMLEGEGGAALRAVWRRRGKRSFDMEAEREEAPS